MHTITCLTPVLEEDSTEKYLISYFHFPHSCTHEENVNINIY